jgi:thiamine-monophosphate kinase
MVEGVHFLAEDPPETIGAKLLRVNLSDLAAMGAAPLGYLLTAALPRGTPDEWTAAFAAGLEADNRAFGVHALGGDTVSTPGPAAFSLTVLGTVAPGAALLRGGARPGDRLWVSGTLGDGALGLRVLRGELAPDPAGHLARRYRLPEPRLALGAALAGVATAAMDVSDGLAQDLGHLCRASGCGAVVEAAALPLSDAARTAVEADPARLPLVLAGGDDYELLFAAPLARSAEVLARAMAAGTPVAMIGAFVEGPPEVSVRGADGAPVPLPRGGWSHF